QSLSAKWRGAGAGLSPVPLWSAARGLPARRARLSRRQWPESRKEGGTSGRLPWAAATRLAQAVALGFASDLEGHRQRHAHQPCRAGRAELGSEGKLRSLGVAGPINAGTFGPNELDASFGREVKFTAIPKDLKPNQPPSAGFQFFGQADIDAESGVMTIALKDLADRTLFIQDLTPVS